MAHRLFRVAFRVLLIALAAMVVLAIAGVLYERWSVRRDAARFPPPGRMVDMGGRRLHLICIGEGEPAVVFESSGFGNATSAEAARRAISAETRVCSYDRMGTAWSEPGPSVVTIGKLADDLKVLLERNEIPPPYILVLRRSAA